MSAINGKNTKIEVIFRKHLWQAGLRSYRLHYKIPGRPDIAFVSKKVAIFIHGCYWHRCPKCYLPIPKSNTGFWSEKFQRNVERDKLKEQQLLDTGWQVLTVWECELKQDIDAQTQRIKAILETNQDQESKSFCHFTEY
jgi:DNA mismatch endonuclease (patch repair protein)